MSNPIIRKKTRILRPYEYEKLRKEIKKHQRHQLDGLLLTGIRYIEARRLQQNPSWYDGGKFIQLPPEASRKTKSKEEERNIRLSHMGEEKIENFLETKKLPHINGWNQNLKRWARKAGINDEGVSAKMTRKTWVSWLVIKYPNYREEIYLNMGHSRLTSINHYLNMSFTERDKEDMEKWTMGWK